MGIEVLFWGALGLVFYAYLGYPALVWAGSRLFPRPVQQADGTPRVSLIIAAHNEAQDISAKLENTLALSYPADKLEIIVASDCSTDATDALVASFAARGVQLYRQTTHLGKTIAQNGAVKRATGDVLVFTDATTQCQPDALRQLVRNFADPAVGCVAGQLIYVESSAGSAGQGSAGTAATLVGQGCRSYWNYEKFVKQCESRLHSLIGVSGCLYAVRRSSYARLTPELIDDFVVATEIHLRGLRTVYEPAAIATERTNQRSRDEFRMRVRVIEQTLTALQRYRAVLNPWRHGLFAWQLLSHKVLRYAVPLLLLVLLLSNAWLADTRELYRLSWLAQAAFYGTALAGGLAARLKLRLGPLALPFYFTLANLAVLAALLKFGRGETHVVWTPLREKHAAWPPPVRRTPERGLG
jgi:cellulose synthase/poly-beta-1,6-N-acetylglucosamine synthase-like glycosyltransferase